MLTMQQANQHLQGSPFSDMHLQNALRGDLESSVRLREIVMELYTSVGQQDSLPNLLQGLDEEYKGYALSIIANFLIYGENDIFFTNTAQELKNEFKDAFKQSA